MPAMDERRFRTVAVTLVVGVAVVVNAPQLGPVMFGGADPQPALVRHVAVLAVGFLGVRIMESIAFRPGSPNRDTVPEAPDGEQ